MSLDAGHVKARLSNRMCRLAIQMAASIQRVPDRIEPVGQRGSQGMMAACMFKEQQRPTRLQHAPNFGQRLHRIGNGTKDKCPHDSLERMRGERQTLCVSLGDSGASTARSAMCHGKHLSALIQRKDTRAFAII